MGNPKSQRKVARPIAGELRSPNARANQDESAPKKFAHPRFYPTDPDASANLTTHRFRVDNDFHTPLAAPTRFRAVGNHRVAAAMAHHKKLPRRQPAQASKPI